MEDNSTGIPLIRTKLHKPVPATDHIHRQSLIKRLDRSRHRPLILVSAPAGYGKSTLMGCWLEDADINSAWVSLGRDENDPRQFLAYLIAALQSIFPEVGKEIQTLLKAPDLPPPSVLSGILINELDQIEDDFVLVLDDYHHIREKAVHEIINGILAHPPKTMQLALVTRLDPPLPLIKLRANDKVTEIRVQALRFSAEETGSFLERVFHIPVDEKTASVLEQKTEGWVAALRLAVLSMRELTDLDNILENLPDDNRYVMDYIISEVLSKESPAIQDFLLSTAILNRFNAALCEVLCIAGTQADTRSIPGEAFIDRLEQANLFVIPLDNRRRWYRYHHLFQQLLQRQIKKRYSPNAIARLHKQAGEWFAGQGLIEEALYHTIEGDDTRTAVRLVAQHRHDLMNREQWTQLERWLGLFPPEKIEEQIELLLSRAWLNYYYWYALGALAHDLDLAEAFTSELPAESMEVDGIMSEVAAIKSGLLYGAADGANAVAKAEQALESAPKEHECVRSTALLTLGGAYQMIGQHGEGERLLWGALQDDAYFHHSSHARMITSLCFAYWCEADLQRTRRTASQLLKLGLEHNLSASTAYARYYLGIVYYGQNKLDAAEEHLRPMVDKPYLYPIHNVMHGSFALSLAYQAQGQREDAREISRFTTDFAFEQRSDLFSQLADAFRAELDLRQERIAEADQWAGKFKPGEMRSLHRFFVPELTWVKALLIRGAKGGQQKADAYLQSLYDFQVPTRNINVLIHILALQALARTLQGDETAALKTLGKALRLAEPSGFIRPFLDLGPKMADLLNRFARQKTDVKYVGILLAAFRNESEEIVRTTSKDQPTTARSPGHPFIDEALSKRELEIMALLDKRMSNKEIAEKLYLSPKTVKSHLYNIYQKLNVSTRRQAVEKATSLGLLSNK